MIVYNYFYQFLTYHPTDRFINHHLCIYKRNKLFAVMPGAEVSEEGGPAFVSYPGASYGGMVVSSDCRFFRIEVWNVFISDS